MKRKRILIAPLHWGLGHASRCIPIIHQLKTDEHEIFLAAEGAQLALLCEAFPDLPYIVFPQFVTVKYSNGNFTFLKILLQLPKMLIAFFKEKRTIKQIVNQYNIDITISDNRYGVRTLKTTNILICHQIMLKMPKKLRFIEPIVYRFHKFLIEKFDECWIPDGEGEASLSGDLSNRFPIPRNAKFIGILSRFALLQPKTIVNQTFDIMVILSGPEPQRSIFERIVINQCKNTNYKCLVVAGKPDKTTPNQSVSENITYKTHLSTPEMAHFIKNTEIIICRAGYSGIMDLVTLQKKAILVPTPGQTEQEYLAEYLCDKSKFVFVGQSDFELKMAIKKIREFIKSEYPKL